MLDIALLLLALAVLALPGFWLWTVLLSRANTFTTVIPSEAALPPSRGTPTQPSDPYSLLEHVTWGTTLGLALAVLLSFFLALFHLSFFWPAWIALVVVAALVRFVSRPSPKAKLSSEERLLLLVLAIVTLSRFAPTFVRATPLGWDPSFHMILAGKINLADALIHDWTPFADLTLNYPLGSHLLIVVLARLTRLPLPRVFQLLIPALGVLTTAQVYSLAARLLRSAPAALFSALAYGAWAWAGSIDYYRWGGLPNQLAMSFLLPIIAVAATNGAESDADHPDRRWAGLAGVAVFFAALCLTHHHVMVASAAVLAVLVIFLLAAGEKPRALRLLARVVLGAVLASPYLLPQAMKLSAIGSTGIFRFDEPHSGFLLIAEIGILLAAAGLAGAVLAYRDPAQPGARLLIAICAALILLYFVCGPLYRLWTLHRLGHAYVAFTPSRFIADLACFLSILTGYALFRIAQYTGLSTRALAGIVLLLALTNLPFWGPLFQRDHDAGRFEAYAWIASHTPPDTFVVSGDPWAAYATWRRTPAIPIPVSEPVPGPAFGAVVLPGSPRKVDVVTVVAPGGVAAGALLWRSHSGWSVVSLCSEAK